MVSQLAYPIRGRRMLPCLTLRLHFLRMLLLTCPGWMSLLLPIMPWCTGARGAGMVQAGLFPHPQGGLPVGGFPAALPLGCCKRCCIGLRELPLG